MKARDVQGALGMRRSRDRRLFSVQLSYICIAIIRSNLQTHCNRIPPPLNDNLWAGQRSRYSNWLRVGRSGDRIPVGARFSAPVQTGPGAHPTSYTVGTGSFPGVKSGRSVTLTPYPLLVPWSRKSRAIPLLPLWAVRPVQSLSPCTEPQCLYRASVPVQSLSACTTVHFTLKS